MNARHISNDFSSQQMINTILIGIHCQFQLVFVRVWCARLKTFIHIFTTFAICSVHTRNLNEFYCRYLWVLLKNNNLVADSR